jgi:hypothetical protein
LEARIAQADSVVVGSIINLSRTVVVPAGGSVTNVERWGDREVRYLSERPDGIVEYISTVQVKEVVKGARRQTVEVFYQTDVHDDRLRQWASERTMFLWLLGDKTTDAVRTNRPPYWDAIRLGRKVAAEQGYSDDPPVFAMYFSRLDTSDQILSRARKYAARRGNPIRFHTFNLIPSETLGAELIVPVEPALERFARRLILRPQDFASVKTQRAKAERDVALYGDAAYRQSMEAWIHSEEYRRQLPAAVRSYQGRLRQEGLNALRYFKSKRNIRIVRSLLDDPSYTVVHSSEPPVKTVKQFYIRSTAHEILKAWEIDASGQVIEEPVAR